MSTVPWRPAELFQSSDRIDGVKYDPDVDALEAGWAKQDKFWQMNHEDNADHVGLPWPEAYEEMLPLIR